MVKKKKEVRPEGGESPVDSGEQAQSPSPASLLTRVCVRVVQARPGVRLAPLPRRQAPSPRTARRSCLMRRASKSWAVSGPCAPSHPCTCSRLRPHNCCSYPSSCPLTPHAQLPRRRRRQRRLLARRRRLLVPLRTQPLRSLRLLVRPLLWMLPPLRLLPLCLVAMRPLLPSLLPLHPSRLKLLKLNQPLP